MHIGLVGLGRMGNNMRARLRNAGIEVTGYDANPAVSDVADLGALAAALPEGKRLVWVMVPHGKITDDVITDLAGVLGEGDLVIDAKGTSTSRHVVIFERWTSSAHTSYWAYEQRGRHGTDYRRLTYGLRVDQYDAYRPTKY